VGSHPEARVEPALAQHPRTADGNLSLEAARYLLTRLADEREDDASATGWRWRLTPPELASDVRGHSDRLRDEIATTVVALCGSPAQQHGRSGATSYRRSGLAVCVRARVDPAVLQFPCGADEQNIPHHV